MNQRPLVEIARRAAAMADGRPILTRFAPAPTGHLHIGHVVNAIFVWGLAGTLRGRVLLRIEDHDRQRCRPEFETALLDDLEWLGFTPDIFPISTFRAGPCDGRQSNRGAAYRDALQPLIERGLVYGCDCTRAAIETAGGSRQQSAGANELWYPGTCRTRGLPLADGFGWRLRIDQGVERLDDLFRGAIEQDPSTQCGDVLLRDRLGNWTYQWAATTDDTLQDITLVVRGMDLLESTGRQIRLARLLGRQTPPIFGHHQLIMKSPAQKVSKSDRDTGVRDLRAAGWSADALIGYAASLAGLQAEAHPCHARLVRRFFE